MLNSACDKLCVSSEPSAIGAPSLSQQFPLPKEDCSLDDHCGLTWLALESRSLKRGTLPRQQTWLLFQGGIGHILYSAGYTTTNFPEERFRSIIPNDEALLVFIYSDIRFEDALCRNAREVFHFRISFSWSSTTGTRQWYDSLLHGYEIPDKKVE